MIDYIALTIGHGLLAYALWHLFMREGLDADPLIERIGSEEKANRKATSAAGRAAARREGEMRSSSASGSAQTTRSSSASGSAQTTRSGTASGGESRDA